VLSKQNDTAEALSLAQLIIRKGADVNAYWDIHKKISTVYTYLFNIILDS
jgi:hypothetical protein